MSEGLRPHHHERYEYKPPPKKYKSCKSLERNKKNIATISEVVFILTKNLCH